MSHTRSQTIFLTLSFLVTFSMAADTDCWKSAYGRGVGKVIHACKDGYEKSGLLCYPECKDGYKGVGPVCWGPWLKSYGRGWGEPLGCSSDEEYDAGLCYKTCNTGYKGIGPVCWGNCASGMTDCGALCTASAAECATDIGTFFIDTVSAIIEMIGTGEGDEVEWPKVIES